MKTSLKAKLTSLTLGLTMALGGLVGLGAEAAKESKAEDSFVVLTTSTLTGKSAPISWSAGKGGAGTNPAIFNSGIRLYQNEPGGYIQLTADDDYLITGFSAVNTNTYATSAKYLATDTVPAGNPSSNGESTSVAKSGTYSVTGLSGSKYLYIINYGTGSKGRFEISSITVYYKKDEGSPSDITQLVSPTNINVNNTGIATWNSVENASSYSVCVDNSNGTYTALTSGEKVPGWSSLACGSHTLYVKAVGDNTSYSDSAPASATFTIPEPPADPNAYTLVTNVSDLEIGSNIVIASADNNYAMSTTQNSNNRGITSITKSGNTITTPSDAVQIFTLEKGASDGTYSFYTGSGYIYAASSSSNQLKTETTKSKNSSFEISINNKVTSIVAKGTNTRNVLRYNSSSSLFACYSSATQDAVCLYQKKVVKKTIAIKDSNGKASCLLYGVGSTKQLYAYDGETLISASTLSWKSDNESVATVDETGLVTVCEGVGLAKISCSNSEYLCPNENSYNIDVRLDQISSISLSGDLTVKEYTVGDNWDNSGLVVTATYLSGKQETIDSGITFTYDPAKPALDTTSVQVTATYNSMNSLPITVSGVSVKAAVEARINSSVESVNGLYGKNVTIDLETANFGDNLTYTWSDNYEGSLISIDYPDERTGDKISITINCNSKGDGSITFTALASNGKSATKTILFNVNVEKTGIEAEIADQTLSFYEGDSVPTTAVHIKEVFSDGSKSAEWITTGFSVDQTALTADQTTVTITDKDNFTCECALTVNAIVYTLTRTGGITSFAEDEGFRFGGIIDVACNKAGLAIENVKEDTLDSEGNRLLSFRIGKTPSNNQVISIGDKMKKDYNGLYIYVIYKDVKAQGYKIAVHESIDASNGAYHKTTNIKDGMLFTFVGENLKNNNLSVALRKGGDVGKNNLTTTGASNLADQSNSAIIKGDSETAIFLLNENSDKTYCFQILNGGYSGQYLYAPDTTDKNYLQTTSDCTNTKAKFSIALNDDGTFAIYSIGATSRNKLLFNFVNSSNVISCYKKDTDIYDSSQSNPSCYNYLNIYEYIPYEDEISSFENKYLKLNGTLDYPDNAPTYENTGNCLSTENGGKGYYSAALEQYNKLSTGAKKLFLQQKYAKARERFIAWGEAAEGKTITFDLYTGAITKAGNNKLLFSDNPILNEVATPKGLYISLIVLGVSIAAIGATGLKFKRKED